MVINIEPIVVEGEHWIGVTMDGHETNRHGPYHDSAEAEAMAQRLRQFGRTLTRGGIGRG